MMILQHRLGAQLRLNCQKQNLVRVRHAHTPFPYATISKKNLRGLNATAGAWSQPTSSDDEWTSGAEQMSDGVVGMAQTAWMWSCGLFNTIVRACTDAFIMSPLSPIGVRRPAVETSIRGAFGLLTLVLLKSVISVVVGIGFVVLAFYMATQVFGLRIPAAGAARTSPQSGTGAPWAETGPRTAGRGARQQYRQYTNWNGEPETFSGNQSPTQEAFRQGPYTRQTREAYQRQRQQPGYQGQTGRAAGPNPSQSQTNAPPGWIPNNDGVYYQPPTPPADNVSAADPRLGRKPGARRRGPDVIDVFYDPA